MSFRQTFDLLSTDEQTCLPAVQKLIHVIELLILQYFEKHGRFFYLNRWAKKCFVCRIRICGEIYTLTAEHVFISNGYIYAATACRLWRVKRCIFEYLDVYSIILWCIFKKSLCIFYNLDVYSKNLDVYSKNLDVDYIVFMIHIWKILMYIL